MAPRVIHTASNLEGAIKWFNELTDESAGKYYHSDKRYMSFVETVNPRPKAYYDE
jgi:glucose-6-phosphate isomerase